jgi:hypothetical protein
MVGDMEMTNYLENIDLLKKLQPILDGLGVKPDRIVQKYSKHFLDYCEAVNKESLETWGETSIPRTARYGELEDSKFIDSPHEINCQYRFKTDHNIESYYYQYRSDTLENVLPVELWAYDDIELGYTDDLRNTEKGDRFYAFVNQGSFINLFMDAMTSRGQPKLEALAELIILLHENGIELKRGGRCLEL